MVDGAVLGNWSQLLDVPISSPLITVDDGPRSEVSLHDGQERLSRSFTFSRSSSSTAATSSWGAGLVGVVGVRGGRLRKPLRV